MKENITDRAKRYRAQKNRPPGRKLCTFCTSRKNVEIDHITGDESDGEPENLMFLCRACNTTKGYVQARNRVGVRTAQYNPEQRPTLDKFKHAAAILLGKIKGDVAAATRYIRGTSPEKRADFAEQMAERNPFKSEAQRRKFYAMAARGEISRATVEKFERETPPGSIGNPIAVFDTKAAAQSFATRTPGSFVVSGAAGSYTVVYDRGARRNPPTFAQYAHGVAEHRRGAHDEGGAIIHGTPPALRSKYARKIASIKKGRRGEVPF